MLKLRQFVLILKVRGPPSQLINSLLGGYNIFGSQIFKREFNHFFNKSIHFNVSLRNEISSSSSSSSYRTGSTDIPDPPLATPPYRSSP